MTVIKTLSVTVSEIVGAPGSVTVSVTVSVTHSKVST